MPANPDIRPSGPLFYEASQAEPAWDRRRWSGAETRAALKNPPDGYVYACGGCGNDMPDDEATYSSFHDDYVCKACAC